MPSEAAPTVPAEAPPALADRAYAAILGRIERFRHAVSLAEQAVREDLVRRTGLQGFKGEHALIELGPFATGRIDPDRFAMLLGIAEDELTPESLDVMAKADAILAGFAETSVHRVVVEPGGDLRDAVKTGLAHLGQTFGAARAVEMARAGTFDPIAHGHLLGPVPFRLWNRAERGLAPPLLVEVRGEDCLPAGLGEFLDGSVTIVLVVTGPTTPAPLARLVTPGTVVIQTADVDDLARLESSEHPAVVLIFDEDRPQQAHFVHDPDAGDSPWARISVSRMPSDADVGRGRRAPTWLEELEHLRELSEAPSRPFGATNGTGPGEAVGTPVATPASPSTSSDGIGDESSDPVDRLAAWLMAQTEVSDL